MGIISIKQPIMLRKQNPLTVPDVLNLLSAFNIEIKS